MKTFFLPFLFLAFTNSAIADAEITSGDKLFVTLDQSIQSKEIKEPTSSAARQKYVNTFLTGSTSRHELKFKRNIIKVNNVDHNSELKIKSDKSIAKFVTSAENKYYQLENFQVATNFLLDTNENNDLNIQSWKLTQTKHNENQEADSASDVGTDIISKVKKINAKNSIDAITFDSGYISANKADNYSYKLFAVEGQRAYNRLFEVINRKYLSDLSSFTRIGYFLGSSFVVSTSINAIPTTYHEWGHFSRDRALGGTSSNIHAGKELSYVGGDTTFFSYLLSSQKAIGQSAYVAYSDSNNYVGNSSGGNAVKSIVYGAGLNNETALAEHYDEEFFFYERPTLFNSLWQMKSRLGPSLYRNIGGDIDLAVSDYNSNGVTSSLTADKLRAVNVYSLLSGSNISALIAAYNYTSDGVTNYTPLMWGNFLVPNQSNYFSTRGITRKIQSGYAHTPNTKFVFGLEYVDLGQSFTEYNFGVNHNWDSWQAYGKLTVSEKGYLNAEFNLSKKLTQNLKLGAYLAQWDSRSLLGERNSLKLSANTTNQGGLRISYLY